jgi:transposase
MTPEEEITRLKAENTRQRDQIAALLERVQELEARLAKDSHNSNKPPASDPLGRKRPRSQRRRSGKKPGGQLGRQGRDASSGGGTRRGGGAVTRSAPSIICAS